MCQKNMEWENRETPTSEGLLQLTSTLPIDQKSKGTWYRHRDELSFVGFTLETDPVEGTPFLQFQTVTDDVIEAKKQRDAIISQLFEDQI